MLLYTVRYSISALKSFNLALRDEYLFVTYITKFPVRSPFTRVTLTTPRPIQSRLLYVYCFIH